MRWFKMPFLNAYLLALQWKWILEFKFFKSLYTYLRTRCGWRLRSRGWAPQGNKWDCHISPLWNECPRSRSWHLVSHWCKLCHSWGGFLPILLHKYYFRCTRSRWSGDYLYTNWFQFCRSGYGLWVISCSRCLSTCDCFRHWSTFSITCLTCLRKEFHSSCRAHETSNQIASANTKWEDVERQTTFKIPRQLSSFRQGHRPQ